MKIRIAGMFVAVVFWVSPAFAWQGYVVKVLDGDSIRVKRAGKVYEIRLYGIDTPEYKQPFGKKAGRLTRRMLLHKNVVVQPVDVDHYGRIVALVSRNGRLVNQELVRQGAAWLYPRYCTRQPLCRELRKEERQAREQHLGLWAGSNPLSPSQWKRLNKKSSGRHRLHFRRHRQH